MIRGVKRQRPNSITPPVALFQGFNSVTGHGASEAVRGEFKTTDAVIEVFWEVCTDEESLHRALKIDSSLDVGVKAVASKAKLEYVRSLKIHKHNVIAVAHASKSIKQTRRNVKLRDEVEVPDNKQELEEFIAVFGDSFVSSIEEGGEYFATLLFNSGSMEEQKKIVGKLSAAGMFQKVSLDGSFKKKLKKVLRSIKTKTSCDHRATGFIKTELPGPNPSSIIDYALAFPRQKVTSPMILSFTCCGYEQVPRLVRKFANISGVRDYFTGTDILGGGLNEQLEQLQFLLKTIAEVQGVYRFYGYEDDKLTRVKAEADADLRAINARIIGYRSNPTTPPSPLVLRSLARGLPTLKYKSYSKIYGGAGGKVWNDVEDGDIRGYLEQKTWIKAVSLKTKKGYIAGIKTMYSSAQSAESRICVHSERDSKWETLTLPQPHNQRAAQITQINVGVQGEYVVNRLIIHGVSKRICGGKENGQTITPNIFAPSRILVGFRGRSGKYLDQIEFVYVELKSAKWKTND